MQAIAELGYSVVEVEQLPVQFIQPVEANHRIRKAGGVAFLDASLDLLDDGRLEFERMNEAVHDVEFSRLDELDEFFR